MASVWCAPMSKPVWRDPETGYLRKQMFGRPDHPVEIVRVELPAGQRVTLPASSYAHIRQVVWVQKGSLTLTEAGEPFTLGAGDCLGFGSPSEVTFANETTRSLHLYRRAGPELTDVGDHNRAPHRCRPRPARH